MLSYRFREFRLSEDGDGFHGPIAVYITCEVESQECRGRIQAGAGIAVKWRMTDELHISSGMFGRDAVLRLDE